MRANVMEQDILSTAYQIQMKDRWATVLFCEKDRTIVCRLNSEYVPIEYFKSTFYKVSALVKNGDFEKFVFDKRSLKAFHQPSMEWYFLEWKKEMLSYGLKKHRKILPGEAWFVKAVEVAQKELVARHPDNILPQLDIRYCDSLAEAINS